MKSFITTAVFFCFLLINSSIGAARTIKGYVSDNDGEAIAYASIALFNDSTFIQHCLPIHAEYSQLISRI